MFKGIRLRAAIGWLAVGLLAGVSIALGAVLITGVSVADEAGAPLGVDAVSVQPAAPTSSTPTPSPTPTSDAGEIVDAPDPVEVELGDDHGGDSGGGSDDGSGGDGGDDNSGHGGGSDDSDSGSGSGSDD